MGKKIKILYQFATAKLKTPNGAKEVLKRKKFLEKNIEVLIDGKKIIAEYNTYRGTVFYTFN